LYGLRSALAVFEKRPKDILSVAFDPSLRAEIQPLLNWAAANTVPCREEPDKVLAARADSNQHEGLVLSVRPRSWLAAKDLGSFLAAEGGLCVALDRVRNPQNIGAILRSAAFFGARAVVLGAPAPHPGLPPFALRVAEGGAEHLVFSRTTDLADTLGRLEAAGVHIIGTDSHSQADLQGVPDRGASVLVLGNEREGLHPRVRAQCRAIVGVAGAGTLDSLNVAVAAGVLLSDLWRRRNREARGSRPSAQRSD
jgi:TrmH RNA methyltransferase